MENKNHKSQLINLLNEFHNISLKENFFYVAECGTLLGAIREGKMIEWDDDIDLAISIETYYFLKQKYPNNILDTDIKGYPFLMAKWVPDVNNYLVNDIFLDLFIYIPTNQQKLNKYTSKWNTFRFVNQMFNKGSKWKPFNFNLWLLKICLFPIQWITKKISIEDCINILYEKENPKFIQFLNAPNSRIEHEKVALDIWDRKLIKFEDIEIFIPTNYHKRLVDNYGEKYMIPNKGINSFYHVNTINVKKRKN